MNEPFIDFLRWAHGSRTQNFYIDGIERLLYWYATNKESVQWEEQTQINHFKGSDQ